MKKHITLSAHLSIVMMALVAGIMAMCLFFNSTFLEKYYVYNKKQEIIEGFEEINHASEEDYLGSTDFDIPFERICANGNMSILILSPRGYVVRSSFLNEQNFVMELYEIMLGMHKGDSQIVREEDSYTLEKQTDTRMQSEYLVLYGTLADGNYIYMRTALESIRESALITNYFFLYVGLGAILVGLIIIIFVSRSISKPIMKLSELSSQMSHLDFEAKYEPRANTAREIEQLGLSMNELSETLENTISELKTANVELEKDIQQKEQIDEMRKEFLSNVSHELKTPIALIQGYAEGLKECINDNDESREFYCDVIMDEADKMNQMVKSLLTLNQLEFGNDSVEMSRFNIHELLQGVIANSGVLFEQNGITVEFDGGEALYVWGDEFKVEEVFSNYLSNAIHYAEGEKRIEVTTRISDGLVRVSVFNTGSNIPEEELDKIWIKFYKVDKARTRVYGGSGIGLSIVRAIMDSFHQKCGVCNRPDGVEFWFELECSS